MKAFFNTGNAATRATEISGQNAAAAEVTAAATEQPLASPEPLRPVDLSRGPAS